MLLYDMKDAHSSRTLLSSLLLQQTIETCGAGDVAHSKAYFPIQILMRGAYVISASPRELVLHEFFNQSIVGEKRLVVELPRYVLPIHRCLGHMLRHRVLPKTDEYSAEQHGADRVAAKSKPVLRAHAFGDGDESQREQTDRTAV